MAPLVECAAGVARPTNMPVNTPVAIQDPKQARTFLLAGNAHATFVSEKTGTHFTYRVSAPLEGPVRGRKVHFVAVLTSPDHYDFLGTIFDAQCYIPSRKSRIAPTAPSAMAFAWVWKYLAGGQLPPQCHVYHEGRCGRCGRRLTTPESIARGMGPECSTRTA